MIRGLVASCVVFAAMLSGCSRSMHPTIEVTGASPGSSSDHAKTVQLMLRLDNPNDEPLELLEFNYTVEVDGRRVFRGTRSAQMTLIRQSTRDVELPAVIPFDVMGWHEGTIPETAQVRVSGTLRYILPGAIAQTLFDTGVRRPRASFQGRAEVAMAGPASMPAQ